MVCPKCKYKDTRVLDSRAAHEKKEIRRRRQCSKCRFRFTTFERVESANFIIIKNDLSRESYDRKKLERGIWKACEKRPVSQEQVDKLLNELEEEFSNQGREVSSKIIGESTMEKLRKLDDVAYIRFASVYRQFRDLETFKKELQKLIN